MFTPRQSGRQISVCASKRKLDTSEARSARERAIYAIIQPNLRKQWFGLFQIRRRCAAVAVTYFMAATSEEKPRLDGNVEDNPRSRSVAPSRAAAGRTICKQPVCSVEIYGTPVIFHYRLSWTSRCAGAHMYPGRNICPHVPHNTSRVCATRVRANSRDSNSSHVLVINAITYKLWRELEPHGDLYRGFSLAPASVPRSLSLPALRLCHPLEDH